MDSIEIEDIRCIRCGEMFEDEEGNIQFRVQENGIWAGNKLCLECDDDKQKG